jgi:N-methylhydantoinase A
MSYRLGIDIGGTFTDFALIGEESGTKAIHKQLTTPEDPSRCVMEGIQSLLSLQKISLRQVSALVHGTTLVTNAVIERKGAVTGMITTNGFRDVLDMGRERRYDLFDLRLVFPEPLIPRGLRLEVEERIRYDGEVVFPLNLGNLRETIYQLLRRHKIESLAVCFLHSYINPVHEQKVCAFLKDQFPELYVSASSDVFPSIREYERFTTTSVNAYVQPIVDRYLNRLEEGLRTQGFQGRLYIMTSSGGTVTPDAARRFPVRMLESGPAAGVLMSAHHGALLNLSNLLSFDMGGTTAKGALIRGKTLRKNYEMEVARVHEFKQGSGLPVKTPVIDMIEIGAGGGSIAEVDERGLIRVGPRSAGADPGPACYGRGGKHPTLTDADLVLGYLDPRFFLGGKMNLDKKASEEVILKHIGSPLGMDLTASAWGIHEIVNEDVARAFRIHASERGVDYRNCSMVAFGGSGPVHASRVARKLKIPRVIFPIGAGVMSAFGLLVSPLSFDVARSFRVGLEDLTPESFNEKFQPMIEDSMKLLRQSGVKDGDVRLTRRLDLRYQGQGFEIEVLLPDTLDTQALLSRIPELFARQYEKIFSISLVDKPIEIVNWKVEAAGPHPNMEWKALSRETSCQGEAVKGRRPAYFPEEKSYIDSSVYDRYALRPGMDFEGPVLVEERESTCVVGIGEKVRVDDFYNLIIDLE